MLSEPFVIIWQSILDVDLIFLRFSDNFAFRCEGQKLGTGKMNRKLTEQVFENCWLVDKAASWCISTGKSDFNNYNKRAETRKAKKDQRNEA